MDEKKTHQLAINVLKYKRSLHRIVQKYSNLPDKDMPIEVDLNTTSTEKLMHYVKLSQKQIKAMESESLLNSGDDLLQSNNSSSISQLDLTQQGGGADETHVSCQMSDDDDDGVSNVRSRQSSLDGSQTNFPETDVLPEDQDEELEMSLRSQGSTLLELYPGMIDRIGRARHRWHVSKMGGSVLRKYHKWRRKFSGGNLTNTVVTRHGRTTSKGETKNLGSSMQVLSPSRSSSPNLDQSLWVPSPSKSSSPSSDQSRSKRISSAAAGEQLSLWVPSPSKSSSTTSDQSKSKRLCSAAAGAKLSLWVPSPSKSSSPASNQSKSKRLCSAAVGDQLSLWVPSPSKSSSPASDQSRSKRLCSAAAGEQLSLWVPSPSKSSSPSSDQSLRAKRLSNTAYGERPFSYVLSPSKSSSPSSDQSLRAKRLSNTAYGERPFSYVLSPSKSSSPSSDQSLRAKRLSNTASGERPSSYVLSPSSPSSDLSLRSKRFARAPAPEQHQTSSWVLSPSRSFDPLLDLSLRSKRLALFAANEQQQSLRVLGSLQSSSSPSSDLSPSSRTLFPSTGIASESIALKERPDVSGFPVRQSEGLRRSLQALSRSPNSAHVLGYSRSSASPLRKPLEPQALHPKSCLGSPPQARNKLWRHLSFDSGSITYSKQDLEDDYNKHYHKFVCLSKHYNWPPGRLCVECAEARRHHSSQTLAALALSPHCFELRKRHRELDWEISSHSKRWRPYSPELKRHRNEKLRRRLCLPDSEASQCGVFKQSTIRGYSGRPLLEDSMQARGLPEETLLGSPGEANTVRSY